MGQFSVEYDFSNRFHRNKLIMGGDTVVLEDHSPLAMRVLVESTAALMSALSVGMFLFDIALTAPTDQIMHLFRYSIMIMIVLHGL